MNKQIVGSLHRLQALACHFPSLSNSVCLVSPNPLTTAPSAWSSLDCMALYPPPFNPNLTFCLPELASICVSCSPLSEDEATISGGTAIRPCESPAIHYSQFTILLLLCFFLRMQIQRILGSTLSSVTVPSFVIRSCFIQLTALYAEFHVPLRPVSASAALPCHGYGIPLDSDLTTSLGLHMLCCRPPCSGCYKSFLNRNHPLADGVPLFPASILALSFSSHPNSDAS